ncbi:hypothetical protein YC2023_045570 [Brassica napus]
MELHLECPSWVRVALATFPPIKRRPVLEEHLVLNHATVIAFLGEIATNNTFRVPLFMFTLTTFTLTLNEGDGKNEKWYHESGTMKVVNM